MTDLAVLRTRIAEDHLAPEGPLLARLIAAHAPDAEARARAAERGAALVTAIRNDSRPGLMEVFLAEYGLSTDEGIALMCLAEALLRVPDAATMDDLIEDKIAPSEWGRHLGHSSSPLVNASTWALMLTGKVLAEDREPGITATLRGAVKRLGEPVIRAAVQRAMKEMGQQFVLGETIADAIRRGRGKAAQGFTFSYDMLGEAAMTAEDAAHYLAAYRDAIAALAAEARSDDIRANPGISIKLSALHPRYEEWQRDRVMAELAPVVLSLAQQAKAARMGLNIDAEEADRLDLSLDLIETVLSDPSLAGWGGFGVVVQGYGKRAPAVIDWLHALATRLDRRIMVRLVKGAYWDTEIKRAQVDGFPDFPVWTRKAATDAAYICCAAKLLGMTDRIYPQVATHNAHTAAAILDLAGGRDVFEFQRLHGMGEALHDILVKRHRARSRIYAPVGAHRDLLAYLVRRLLENGANSSFVNQVVDASVPAAQVAADPVTALDHAPAPPPPGVDLPRDLYAPRRPNSRGFDLRHPATLDRIDAARAPFRAEVWDAGPILAGSASPERPQEIRNPASPADLVGLVADATAADIETALSGARAWIAAPEDRAEILNRAADLFEAHMGEIFALLAREAGKTLPDALSELREAVDFLRYYASFATGDAPRGTIACISPWNFPLAIFTGQIAGALAAGNAVVAKPAEATPLIAARAVELMHEAGVPRTALQFLPGTGATVGRAITSDPRIAGVVFTGSTATAKAIDRAMAAGVDPFAPLVAETGGLNAMIVDSTALPEQAVRDIVASAFRSAGQRCSALRCVYVQQDVADRVLEMLHGAMRELRLGDPWDVATDVGPIISAPARDEIAAHVETARRDGRLIAEIEAPGQGAFIGPAMIRVSGIGDLEREVFGPVLHVATFHAADIDRVIDAVNATGYGLTFGLHTRIDDRVARVTSRLKVGNTYVNRNQIGAVVGSQPFGGEGLSGTGPKAGGPHYVARFRASRRDAASGSGGTADAGSVRAALVATPFDPFATLSTEVMPGPTGELNRLTTHPRGPVLCLGPGSEAATRQAEVAKTAGCPAIEAPGLEADALRDLPGLAVVAFDGPQDAARAYRTALAGRPGPVVPLARSAELAGLCRIERHLCIDTTASGGNATLLATSA
jgi:RHH-type transcriptional regulator, proline utilization regulon repressor / proline dehydrogenase / delta 1-pyrroline-5-carboxylate dehydrogenase